MKATRHWIGMVLAWTVTHAAMVDTKAAESHRAGGNVVAPLPTVVSLVDCLETALRQNRELQIERLNPSLAREAMITAGAAYDPQFAVESRWESLADTGGLDPADFSRDAIYKADSETARMSLGGSLPTGMTYGLTADYAHSDGVRNALEFDAYSLRLGAMVRQPLLRNLWIDAPRLSIRVNRLQVKSAELALRFRVMDVASRVAHAFHELGYSQEFHRTHEELLRLRQSIHQTVRRRVASGTLTTPDESLAAAQVATAEANLASAFEALELARHTLRALLGDSWNTFESISFTATNALEIQPVNVDLADSWESARRARPDLALFQTELERHRLEARFWRNQLFPALDVVGIYGRRGASTAQVFPPFSTSARFGEAWDEVRDGTAPNQGIGFVFSTPLSRRAERSQYRTSKDLRAQVELRLLQQEENLRREIADAGTAVRAAWSRIDLTREARQRSVEVLEAEERKLSGGKSTVYFVLQYQSDLAQARIAEHRARADHLQAQIRLHFADGRLLERLGARFEIRGSDELVR
ncbi:MAG: TolC family protein [Verrucomicrobiales bacterium]|nr:TolC family protein [Verrucomicrobiales bacterium]